MSGESLITGGDLKQQVLPSLVLMGFTSVVGSVGNLVVILVYMKKKGKQTANLFIFVLAMVDFLTCSIIIPMTMRFEHVFWRLSSELLCRFYHFLNTSNIPFSCLLISAIAVDRYLCICHPFKRLMTVPRAIVVVLVLFIVSVMFGLLAGLYSSLHPLVSSSNSSNSFNSTKFHNLSTDMTMECVDATYHTATNTLTVIIIKMIQFVNLFCFLVCIVCVTVLYVLIYHSVLRLRQKRKHLHGMRGKYSSCPVQSTISNADAYNSTIQPTSSRIPAVAVEMHADEEAGNGSERPRNQQQNLLALPSPLVMEEGVSLMTDAPSSIIQSNGVNSKLTRVPTRFHKDSAAVQNVKTAIMLFVVALVFLVTFTPALLMASGLLSLNLPLFYLYYLNNTANPIIYCFMNKNFRDDVLNLFNSIVRSHRRR